MAPTPRKGMKLEKKKGKSRRTFSVTFKKRKRREGRGGRKKPMGAHDSSKGKEDGAISCIRKEPRFLHQKGRKKELLKPFVAGGGSILEKELVRQVQSPKGKIGSHVLFGGPAPGSRKLAESRILHLSPSGGEGKLERGNVAKK